MGLGAIVALAGHGIALSELTALYGGFSPAVRQAMWTVIAGGAPYLCLLLALAVVGVVRWSRLFPWGALAVPWLIAEATGAIETATQPALTGRLPIASGVAGAADILVVVALVGGTLVWWRRWGSRRPSGTA